MIMMFALSFFSLGMATFGCARFHQLHTEVAVNGEEEPISTFVDAILAWNVLIGGGVAISMVTGFLPLSDDATAFPRSESARTRGREESIEAASGVPPAAIAVAAVEATQALLSLFTLLLEQRPRSTAALWGGFLWHCLGLAHFLPGFLRIGHELGLELMDHLVFGALFGFCAWLTSPRVRGDRYWDRKAGASGPALWAALILPGSQWASGILVSAIACVTNTLVMGYLSVIWMAGGPLGAANEVEYLMGDYLSFTALLSMLALMESRVGAWSALASLTSFHATMALQGIFGVAPLATSAAVTVHAPLVTLFATGLVQMSRSERAAPPPDTSRL